MRIVVHLSGEFIKPMSDEVEADSVSWSTNTVAVDCKHGVVYYPREKVVKVEVLR